MNASPQMNYLTAAEFRKLIARMGGLWSGGMLGEFFGAKARNWPNAKRFPDPAWEAGKIRLYSGWEVWLWLGETGRNEEALLFKSEINSMGKRRFDA